MSLCSKCHKDFITPIRLQQHLLQNKNCVNKCSNCLKIFSRSSSLARHATVNCKQRYECNKCSKIYGSNHTLTYHKCKEPETNIEDPHQQPNYS